MRDQQGHVAITSQTTKGRAKQGRQQERWADQVGRALTTHETYNELPRNEESLDLPKDVIKLDRLSDDKRLRVRSRSSPLLAADLAPLPLMLIASIS